MNWNHAVCRADQPDVWRIVDRLAHRTGRDLDLFDLFFPSGTEADVRTLTNAAVRLCHTCPLLTGCAEWAVRSGQWDGIHGGLTRDGKAKLARRMGEPRHAWVA